MADIASCALLAIDAPARRERVALRPQPSSGSPFGKSGRRSCLHPGHPFEFPAPRQRVARRGPVPRAVRF
eukprot:1043770-Alexandrium_andersonii.AAC.1